MNTTQTIQGLILGTLFIGTVAFGQFVAPAGKPTTALTDSVGVANTGSANQIKDGSLGASKFIGTNGLCLGASNCITSWWPTTSATTCKLEVKKIFSNTSNLPVFNNQCESVLTQKAKDDGWVSTSFDYCTSLSSGNCNGGAQCTYMRLACTGSATSTTPTSNFYNNIFPVTGDGYPYFVRNPQCDDGLNNDGLVGVDYPADPQCANYADDDESS